MERDDSPQRRLQAFEYYTGLLGDPEKMSTAGMVFAQEMRKAHLRKILPSNLPAKNKFECLVSFAGKGIIVEALKLSAAVMGFDR